MMDDIQVVAAILTLALDSDGQGKKPKAGTERRENVLKDNDDLDRLREYQQRVGVPVSESVRHAIKAHLETLLNRRAKQNRLH
jgi:hypothetical protein